MAETSQHHVEVEGYAPLKDSMATGLVLFGDSNVDMMDGSLAMMLLFFANTIVDEINSHPYREGMGDIEKYVTPSDKRPIDDQIMAYGLAALYAEQQASAKYQALLAKYYKTMNQSLWHDLNGNTDIDIRSFDRMKTSETNGSLTSSEDN